MKKITRYFLFILLVCSISAVAQPTNNLPCGAIELTVNESGICSNQVYSFDGSETDSNMGIPACTSSYSGEDLWFKFNMPADGAVTIKTSYESVIDNIDLEVFAGNDCNTLTSIGCNADGNPDVGLSAYYAQIDVVQPAGSTVYFRVWDVDYLEEGSFNVCVYKIDSPMIATNDDCSSPINLTLSADCSSPILATNFQATPSNGIDDPSCGIYEGYDDVWFTVNVDDTKFYDITIETSEDTGSAFLDTGIVVYSGSCDGTLTEIENGCDDDKGNKNFSKVTIENRRNETLFVRVFPSFEAQTGTFNICAIGTETLSLKSPELFSFNLYPNPTKSFVNLKFNNNISSMVNIDIYNLQGTLVQSTKKELQNSHLQLDVSFLSDGFYFLKVNDGLNSLSKKLIIK
ncbi:T9SS type A sorting domain-containing protein [Aestuariibaculum sp. YM273]|uniref:T9SS type A sorting domain-containing protein n=1 Tax=Aestuariibaculum sp. YM273 TaxID=3070659 RepID=UPI0027DB3C1F|nr:T9SS type A sorting domain-containing protein [Aestuariibaculum sp. YM273]WMI65045.1 T9SS type A sorting domain-containing protein [Aestuariibaculum sp. YM273]